MGEVKKKVDSYTVTYTCSKCEQGDMVPTGIALMSYPPKYPHVCNNCGNTMVLSQRYPRQVYE